MFKKPKVLFAGYKTIPKELEELNQCCQTQTCSLQRINKVLAGKFNAIIVDTKSKDIITSLKNNAGSAEVIGILETKPIRKEEYEYKRAGLNEIVVKSANTNVFVQRTRNALCHVAQVINNNPYFCVKKYELWVFPLELRIGADNIPLTYREFQCVLMLMKAYPDKVSREDLYNLIWCKKESLKYKELNVTIKRIRTKLGNKHNIIETLINTGYRLKI